MMTPERIANALLIIFAVVGALVCLYLVGALLGFWRLP